MRCCLHSINYAKSNCDRRLIAIEKTKMRFDKFFRRYQNHGSPLNLAPVNAHAVTWIGQHIKPESVDRYFLLYPNSKPKPSQKNKRWHFMPFAQHLLATKKKGATLT